MFVALIVLIYVIIVGVTIANGFADDGENEGFLIGLIILVPLLLILVKYYLYLNKRKIERMAEKMTRPTVPFSRTKRLVVVGAVVAFTISVSVIGTVMNDSDDLEKITSSERLSGIQSCSSYKATLVGTDGDDVLEGTKDADVIVGLAGDDVIRGLSGDDIICGGPGNDHIIGGPGNDEIDGQGGSDLIEGGEGDDSLNGSGAKATQGDLGDHIIGGPGNDYLNGGGGDDFLESDGEDKNVSGGSGEDRCIDAVKPYDCEIFI